MESKPKRILVTGVTGFVGAELLRYLLNEGGSEIWVVVRGRFGRSAAERIQDLTCHWEKFGIAPEQRALKIIDADLSVGPLPLRDEIDLVFHCAANTDFKAGAAETHQQNTLATQHLLASSCLKGARLVYFSTAFVNSISRKKVDEDYVPFRFSNEYEKSKFAAEQLVKKSTTLWTILRPSIVVGDSQTGYIRGFKVFYALLRIWLNLRFKLIPIDPSARVDVIPIDHLVRCALVVAKDPRTLGQIYHCTSGAQSPLAGELMAAAFGVFAVQTRVLYLPQVFARFLASRWLQPYLPYRLRELVDIFHGYLPYLGSRSRVFANDKINAILKEHGMLAPQAAVFQRRLFEFCRDTRWGKLDVSARGRK